MRRSPRVFVDTNVLFAVALSTSGGSRLLLKLAEAGAITIVVGPRVLVEADAVIARKAPDSRATLLLLLDRARVELGVHPAEADLVLGRSVTDYEPDAHIVGEALAARVDVLATLDQEHLLGHGANMRPSLIIGTPGECLRWLREGWGGAQ